MGWKRQTLVSLGAALAAVAAVAEDVSLSVTANRDQIYIGESILLTVKVSGSESVQPDLSGIRNASVRSLGSRSDSQHSITIINGRIQRNSSIGRVFAYEVTPSSTGAFQAGPVRVVADGRTISDPGAAIQVQGVESQDRVLVEIRASREAVLVDEPFDVTLTVRIQRMQGSAANIEPLDPADPPKLTADFLDGQPIQGLDCPDIKSLLQGRLINRAEVAGLAINTYTVRRDPFSNLFNFNMEDINREVPAKFRLDGRVVELGGRQYVEYSLALRYVAREEGSYTFGPLVFKGKAVVGVNEERRLFGRPVFAVGPASTVRVIPPPEAGRPGCFVGAIGSNVTVKASLDTQTCTVGDPLTLTLEIAGDISKDNIYPPPLAKQADLARDFRVYEDNVQSARKDEARIFSYTIRPARPGTLEVPPIEVGFYNAARRAYEVVKSAPIPLRVNAAQEMGREMIIQTSTNRAAGPTVELRSRKQNVAPMTMDAGGSLHQEIIAWRRVGPLLAAGPACWGCLVLVGLVRRRFAAGADGRRRRRALGRSEALLAESLRAGADEREARKLIAGAIRLYLSNRFAAPAGSLTPQDARRLLDAEPRAAGAAGPLCGLFERNFNAAYGVLPRGDCTVAGDVESARKLLSELDVALRAEAARPEGEAAE